MKLYLSVDNSDSRRSATDGQAAFQLALNGVVEKKKCPFDKTGSLYQSMLRDGANAPPQHERTRKSRKI